MPEDSPDELITSDRISTEQFVTPEVTSNKFLQWERCTFFPSPVPKD